MADKVTKEMNIMEIAQKHPESIEVFHRYGLGCIGCAAARFENLEAGAKVQSYDPKAIDTAKVIFKNKIEYCKNAYDAVIGADALLLVTEWNEFRRPDFDKIKSLLKTPIIFDGRNQYNAPRLLEKGFTYYQIGKI